MGDSTMERIPSNFQLFTDPSRAEIFGQGLPRWFHRMGRVFAGVTFAAMGCQKSGRPSGFVHAGVITGQEAWIGGRAADATAGDFVLENDRVRFVVQPAGTSRAFNIWG